MLIAWSALASAFAPLIIVYALKQDVSEKLAITMVFAGMGAMLAWRSAGLNDYCYEAAPGVVAGLLVFALGKIFALNSGNPSPQQG